MKYLALSGGIFLAIWIVSCGAAVPTTRQDSIDQAQQRAANTTVYQQQNNVELDNYNFRQEVSDDPTTILWCTFFPPMQNVKPITVAIVGKLTSSGKRPFPASVSKTATTDAYSYYPELAGPDAMYGSSSEYRFGKTTAGTYIDFTSMPSVCSTTPSVYATQNTTIVAAVDPALQAASAQAKLLLQQASDEEAKSSSKDANGRVTVTDPATYANAQAKRAQAQILILDAIAKSQGVK